MPFITSFKQKKVRKKILTGTLRGPHCSVMHRFYVAHIVNELISNRIRSLERI